MARNTHPRAATMAQDGGRGGTSLTRAVVWVGVAVAMCELVTACVSSPCPGDQIMIEETCLPAALATKDAQNRRDLRATQVAEEERESDDATP
jgi:hypothetical protein